MDIEKTIEFNGNRYSLMGSGKYYLRQSSTNSGRKQAKGLHVDVWEYYSGKSVPKGYHIHHIDGNPFNNEYSNLICVSPSEHADIHIKQGDWHKTAPTSYALEKAAEWHKSEEGRQWHREQAKKNWDNRKMITKVCLFCEDDYQTPFSDTMYCSDNCGRNHRARNGERHFCKICETDITKLDTRTKYCSKMCKDEARRQRQRLGYDIRTIC